MKRQHGKIKNNPFLMYRDGQPGCLIGESNLLKGINAHTLTHTGYWDVVGNYDISDNNFFVAFL